MASPITRGSTEIKAIPKRVYVSDLSDIDCPYSSTPGGTLYSTTPGGTKIVYERSFLMNMRNSPLSKTPPAWDIPASLLRSNDTKSPPKKNGHLPISKLTAPPFTNGYKCDNRKDNNRNHVDEGEQFALEL